MAKHFDVVVLGTGLGALATAALLARRAWRVLVVGQHDRPATYAFDGLPFVRRPFTFLTSATPAWSRIAVELAQSQILRRRLTPVDPMYQVLGPRLRLDVPPDRARFGEELERELPGACRTALDLYARLAEFNAVADAAFARDLVLPPATFWERREVDRALASVRSAREGFQADWLAELGPDHPFRACVDAPVRFASHAFGPLPRAAWARLNGAWARGIERFSGGLDGLSAFFLERVVAHGGEVRLDGAASRVLVRRGQVHGVEFDGDDRPTGAQFVVWGGAPDALFDLCDDGLSLRRALDDHPVQVAPAAGRFVVSVVVRNAGLPPPLADEAFVLPERRGDVTGRSAWVLRLQRRSAEAVLAEAEGAMSATRPALRDVSVLAVEALLPFGAGITLGTAREEVLARLSEVLPFFEHHVLAVDSPHDGLPLWDRRSGKTVAVERAGMRGGRGSVPAEPMDVQWAVEGDTLGGLGGVPLRSPLRNAFFCGSASLPALGQEGEWLAAWGVARVITRTNRARERMRREMWSKVELT